MIVPSPHPAFDHALSPSSFYVAAAGARGYYDTRQTDGGRPAIYANVIAALEKRCALVVGLGCGDSATERVVSDAVQAERCIGVDIASDMGEMSALTFAGSAAQFDFVEGDFADASLRRHLVEQMKQSGKAAAMLVGRTFGNFPPRDMARILLPLARAGRVYVDFFSAGESAFVDRMIHVSRASRAFFLAPLRAAGIAPEGDIQRLIVAEETGSACHFWIEVEKDASLPNGRYLLFTIRTFDVERLVAVLAECGLECVLRHDMPEQILPMSLLGLSSPS